MVGSRSGSSYEGVRREQHEAQMLEGEDGAPKLKGQPQSGRFDQHRPVSCPPARALLDPFPCFPMAPLLTSLSLLLRRT